MPVLPIHLQTMFSQMNQVGKEQAQQQQAAPAAQSEQASEIVRQSEARDNSVNQSADAGDGPEGVNDGEERQGSSEEQHRGKEEKQDKPEKRPVFTDPDLGHHIDITR